MQVVVVGAGVTGLMSAFVLTQRKHQVTVLEARSSPCQEASYSCSGTLGDPTPTLLASPTSDTGHLGSEAPLVYGSSAFLKHPHFIRKLLQNKDAALYASRLALFQELSVLSTDQYRQFCAQEGFTLQESAGTLLATRASHPHEGPSSAPLEQWLQIEPALYAVSPQTHWQFSRATSWSISYFAKQLKEWLLEHGVNLLSNQAVTDFIVEGERAVGVKTATQTLHADAIVVAAGLGSTPFLKRLKLKCPLVTLTRCFSNTLLLNDTPRLRHAVKDTEGYHLAPLDDFLRIQGRWFLGDETEFDRENEYKALWETAMYFVPELAQWNNTRYLSQKVLSTPDGLALVGASPVLGVYLNMAGGIHGADYAPVYAQTLADAIEGNDSPYLSALSPMRFH